MTFGSKLVKLREEKGLSQEQMAELLDVSRQSISKWESDKSFPEIKRILFISEYFEVSLDYLFKDTEDACEEKEKVYRADALHDVVLSFISNLTYKQRIIVYMLVLIALVSFCAAVTYLLGYATGHFLYIITH